MPDINLTYQGLKAGEQSPEASIYAFDANGQFIASAPVQDAKAQLQLPERVAGRTVRLFVGPRRQKRDTSSVADLTRQGAYELRERIDPAKAAIDLTVYEPIWRGWFLCPCVVTGQLVTTVTLPNGTTKQLPICNAQVTICEVWAIPILIYQLPDDIIYRLRDEAIAVLTKPFPPPPPSPDGFTLASQQALALRSAPAAAASASARREIGLSITAAQSAPRGVAAVHSAAASIEAIADPQLQGKLRVLSLTTSVDELRTGLIDLGPTIIDYFCYWPWLEPWLFVDCFETVQVDDNGKFFAIIYYPCFGPSPNLYFSAQQLQGGVWQTIYRPPVRCATHWNYPCGSNVVLNVTDPSAISCAPSDPVNVPPGVNSWVMPVAVGGSYIRGTFPPPPAPAGWVRGDGFTDYDGIVGAPFGGYLGFRSGASIDIPSAAMQYYRWSYRKMGTAQWFPMSDPVFRHYVKQSPAQLPTFPGYQLGPHTVGPNSYLFQFKPLAPPPPDIGDPPGTITYWPTDDLFADIYSGYLNTPSLPTSIAAAAGEYQIKMEVFDSAGKLVAPGAGTFTFIVPSGIGNDGVTILARAADASETLASGFVFNLQIDNNKCSAGIEAPSIGGVATADACGFLGYNPGDIVTIAFHAQHPNNLATFNFTMVRGATGLSGADVSGAEVAALSAPPYAGDGIGDFTNGFTVASLLGNCVNAAFAEDVYVFAKATTGWGDRISQYDASFLRAFALERKS